MISPPEDPPRPLKTHKINTSKPPLGIPDPLETYWLLLYQILTFRNALQPEIWQFLDLKWTLVFPVFHIWTHMEGIRRYMEIYAGT